MTIHLIIAQCAWSHPISSLVAGIGGYLLGLAIYRLCFHPLASFPGPKLAAMTQWYEFYFDGVKGGKYLFKIAELHQEYGNDISLFSFFTDLIAMFS